ncbi:restriction endonuclease subunit S, partial [bacterium]|nr:restriction endonuclease subunit S [bacterium]
MSQDPNDEPASELLKRIATEKARLVAQGKIKKTQPMVAVGDGDQLFELPDKWRWVHVGDVALTSTGKTPPTANAYFYGDSIPFIGPGQITLDSQMLQPEKWLSEEGKVETTMADVGDVLMVCIGGSIGKCAIVERETAFNQQI